MYRSYADKKIYVRLEKWHGNWNRRSLFQKRDSKDGNKYWTTSRNYNKHLGGNRSRYVIVLNLPISELVSGFENGKLGIRLRSLKIKTLELVFAVYPAWRLALKENNNEASNGRWQVDSKPEKSLHCFLAKASWNIDKYRTLTMRKKLSVITLIRDKQLQKTGYSFRAKFLS